MIAIVIVDIHRVLPIVRKLNDFWRAWGRRESTEKGLNGAFISEQIGLRPKVLIASRFYKCQRKDLSLLSRKAKKVGPSKQIIGNRFFARQLYINCLAIIEDPIRVCIELWIVRNVGCVRKSIMVTVTELGSQGQNVRSGLS